MHLLSELKPNLQDTRIQRKQRNRVELFGEQVLMVFDPNGIERITLILKYSRMLYYQELLRQDWKSACDGFTLTQVQQRGD